MKYAIVDSGGKQYIAREGETIEVDRLPLEIGKPVEFKDVLLVADNGNVAVGTPTVKGASVKGRVLDHIKGAKIIVFKYVPKQRYRRKQGHRQRYTRVEIQKITQTVATEKKAAAKEEPKKAPAKKAAEEKPAMSKAKAAPKPAAKKTATKKSTTAKTEKAAAEKKSATSKTTSKKASSSKTSQTSTKKSTGKSTTTKKSSSKK